MGLRTITPPSTLLVSVAEQKTFMRVEHALDDAIIEQLILAATSVAEQHTRRSLMQQSIRLTLDEFPEAIELPRGPVSSVTEVRYTDGSGADVVLSSSEYVLDNSAGDGAAWLLPAVGSAWPATQASANALRVTYVAGVASAADVPRAIKTWVMLRAAQLYDSRGSGDAPQENFDLLSPFVLYQM